MLTSKEFVAKLEKENEALFRASELQIKHYYENVTDKDELIDNFTGRMVNERMNMEEISREVAALPAGTDRSARANGFLRVSQAVLTGASRSPPRYSKGSRRGRGGRTDGVSDRTDCLRG